MTKKIKQFSIFLSLSIFGVFLFLAPNAKAVDSVYLDSYYIVDSSADETRNDPYYSFNFNVPTSCENAFLLVATETWNSDSVNSITYDNASFTNIGSWNYVAGSLDGKLWYLVNPSSGTNLMYFTTGSISERPTFVSLFCNVDPDNPIGTAFALADSGYKYTYNSGTVLNYQNDNSAIVSILYLAGNDVSNVIPSGSSLISQSNGWNDGRLAMSYTSPVSNPPSQFSWSITGSIYGAGLVYGVLNYKAYVPPSTLEITTPAGSMSVNGLSIDLKGTCVSRSGGWIKQLMVGTGSFLPVIDGNCDCKDNAFDCSFVAPTYGTYEITVIDWQDYEDVDTITLDFVKNNINWLDYFSYTYGLTASASTTESSPVDVYQDDGYSQDSVPLYFHFSPAVVASSTALEFRLWNFFDNDMVEVASGTLASLGITSATTTLGYSFNLINATTTNLISTLNKLNGDEVQKNFIELVWHANPRLAYPNIMDMGTYFPRIKETLNKKILFHQFFQIYDTLLNSFNSFNGSATKFSVNANFMTDDGQYGLAIPVLDLSTLTALEFATPLRSFLRGLLIVLFGVWFLLRIFNITSWPGMRD